jgi:hypothetical protein
LQNFPDAIVDYYPDGMQKTQYKPFLLPFESVPQQWAADSQQAHGRGGGDFGGDKSKYVQWRANLKDWRKLQADLRWEELPKAFFQVRCCVQVPAASAARATQCMMHGLPRESESGLVLTNPLPSTTVCLQCLSRDC